MGTSTYKVTGMTCNGCADKVRTQLSKLDGVSVVDVELATGQVTVTADGRVTDTAIIDILEETGYEAVRL
ncbi:heavy-metal-associated domain-containing protein [Micromonospora sp. HM5-17]|uniref:heavy-metal-associated domain-containing protein n=1 Tax=Micromonospora sp. HM5-17 TaxID=2487710 RepID=UPI000F47C0A7|nr:heavy metal-associated domain-containing protein [Micromonospora sp. HM5-17]ROT34270.1 heavy-metal-associated domain-containing protein [Micromonospora sp. HM5-17]